MTTSPSDSATDARHDAFTITRRLDAPPAAVFAAFAEDELRRRWIRMPGRSTAQRHEFRVGAGEDAESAFTMPDGRIERLRNRTRYLDIVTDRRIVFVSESIVDDVTRWASLVTVALSPVEDSSILDWTEQVAFLTRTGDGSADLPHLRGGTALRLNGLVAALNG